MLRRVVATPLSAESASAERSLHWLGSGILALLSLSGPFLVPLRAQDSHRTFLAPISGSVQQAELQIPKQTPSSLPATRFLGWNYAKQQGFTYLARFQRKHANSVIVQPQKPPGAEAIQSVAAGVAALPGLQLRPSLPAGYLPVSVASGDFNGDGNADWVVCNAGDDSLWIFLGRGDGTWQLPTIQPTAGFSPISVVTADLRGDGKLDIVVAEADSGSIAVFLGNGDGTFAPEQRYFLPDLPVFLKTGDFNGDGRTDLLAGVSSAGADALIVLPGLGNGRFGAPVISTVNVSNVIAEWVSVADLNGDGVLDATAKVRGAGTGAVLAFVGRGDGSFVQGQEIASDFIVENLTTELGDLDEDGCVDAVVTDALAHALTYHGNCDGTFGPPTYFLLGDVGISLALRDLDGDGHLEIVSGSILTFNYTYGDVAGNLLSVLQGDGHGNFAQPSVYAGDVSLVGLAFADLNNDGSPDVITANQDSDSASLFLNDGRGGFGPPEGYGVGYNFGVVNSPMSGVRLADLNGDGKQDLVLVELPATSPGNYQIAVQLGLGGGKFSPLRRFDAFPDSLNQAEDFVLADFRNTGHPDFLAVGYGNFITTPAPFVAFAPNLGDGTFGSPSIITPPSGNGLIAVGDFNSDGKLDFVTMGSGDNTNRQSLNVFLGNGDGTFTQRPPVTFGGSADRWAISVYAGDFNRDGKLDVITRLYVDQVPYTMNDVYEFLGNGDGTFLPGSEILSNSDPFTLADVNHDGTPDLVLCRDPQSNFPSPDQSPVISIYLGKGDGSFVPAHTYQPYTSSFVFPTWRGTGNAGGGFCTLGDFNGDGNTDIAIFQRVTGSYPFQPYVQFLLGSGDGSFVPTYDTYRFLNGDMPQFSLDLNGDGSSDLVELDKFSSSFHSIPAAPAAPFQIGLLAQPVVGIGQLQLSLDVPSASSTTFSLSASDPKINLPNTATIAPGSISQIVNFEFEPGFDSHHVFSITADSGTFSGTTYGAEWVDGGGVGFQVGLALPNQGVTPGQSSWDYGPLVASIGGYTTTVTFSCVGLPAQAHCSFSPDRVSFPADGSGRTSLIVNTDSDIPPGTYNFNVRASDGAIQADALATLKVLPLAPDLTLTGGLDGGSPEAGNPIQASMYLDNNGTVTATSTALTFSLSGPVTLGAVSPSQGSCSIKPPKCNLGSIDPAGRVVIGLTIIPTAAGAASVGITASETESDANPADNTAKVSISATDFTIAAAPASATVSAGGDATYDITIAPVGASYTSSISLDCTGAPRGAVCSVAPSVLSIGSSQGSAKATVTTTGNSSQLRSGIAPSSGNTPRRWAVFLWLPFVGGAIILTSLGSNRGRILTRLGTLVLLLPLVSCGGGSSGSSPGGGTGTSPGSYTLTLRASSGSVQRTTTVTLTVQ